MTMRPFNPAPYNARSPATKLCLGLLFAFNGQGPTLVTGTLENAFCVIVPIRNQGDAPRLPYWAKFERKDPINA